MNELDICIIEYSMSGSQPVGQKVKYKSVCLILVKAVTIWHFSQCLTCQLVKHSCGYYWYMSLSGFFTILPYLVLTVFSPSFICSLTTLVLEHTFSVCFSLLLCKLFLTPCSPCIFLLSSLSWEIALSMSVACDYSFCIGDLYLVWLVMMIVITLSNYCTMGPWSPVFLLNHYSWPYVYRHKDSWSIIVWSFLPCLCIRFYDVHHHCLYWLVFYLSQALCHIPGD